MSASVAFLGGMVCGIIEGDLATSGALSGLEVISGKLKLTTWETIDA